MNAKRVALITGGGSGIGKATCLLFAKKGYNVIIGDIGEESGKAVVAEIIKNGGEAIFVKTNVAVESEVENLVSVAVSKYGKLNTAVNCAGRLSKMAPLHLISTNHFEDIMAVNVTGVFTCMKHEITQFMKQGNGGTIVNIASLAGLVGMENGSPYCASKHAVVGLSKAAAKEYDVYNIRVNALCPGFVDTPMVDGLLEEIKVAHKLAEKPPITSLSRHPGKAEECAQAALWLASPESSFVNGTTLTLDGASYGSAT